MASSDNDLAKIFYPLMKSWKVYEITCTITGQSKKAPEGTWGSRRENRASMSLLSIWTKEHNPLKSVPQIMSLNSGLIDEKEVVSNM